MVRSHEGLKESFHYLVLDRRTSGGPTQLEYGTHICVHLRRWWGDWGGGGLTNVGQIPSGALKW